MALDFMIVGTPRSGTTLVQRLASEIEGVRMPPETHFFSRFLRSRPPPLPLEGSSLLEAARQYLALPTSRSFATSAEAITERAGGRCDSYLELFDGVVRALTDAAALVGEKTPEHLLWWRRLAASIPALRFICVIRDPRGVLASHRDVPWGIRSPLHLAEQWRYDFEEIRAAELGLGRDRCLVLRFEDVVADPALAKRRMRAFLGCAAGGDREAGDGIVEEWEWWKHAALRPVDAAKARDWRKRIDPALAADVAALCREPLVALGAPDTPSAEEAAARRSRLGRDALVELEQFRRRLDRRRRWVEAFPLHEADQRDDQTDARSSTEA